MKLKTKFFLAAWEIASAQPAGFPCVSHGNPFLMKIVFSDPKSRLVPKAG